MAVAFDAVTTSAYTGNVSKTFAHTCTGSNGFLFVALSNSSTGTVSSVTYAGVSMSLLSSVLNTDSGANAQIDVYYLKAPSTGSNNVVASFAGPPAEWNLMAESFTEVDQTTSLGTAATATANGSTTPSVTVSGATGDLIVDFCASHDSQSSVTAGSGQTKRSEILTGPALYSSTENGAASVVMNWTLGTSRWESQVGVAIKAAGGGGPTAGPLPNNYQRIRAGDGISTSS